jgi:hypothetical protein
VAGDAAGVVAGETAAGADAGGVAGTEGDGFAAGAGVGSSWLTTIVSSAGGLETPWLGLWAACCAKPAGTSSRVLANAIRAREFPVFLITSLHQSKIFMYFWAKFLSRFAEKGIRPSPALFAYGVKPIKNETVASIP